MDDLDLTPEEQAQFGNVSDEEMLDPVEKALLERLDQMGSLLNSLSQSIEGLNNALLNLARPKKTTLARDASGRATHSITEPV